MEYHSSVYILFKRSLFVLIGTNNDIECKVCLMKLIGNPGKINA